MHESTRFTLADGAELLGMTSKQLWWRYIGLGGTLDPFDFAAMIAGLQLAPRLEVDLAVHAMNEAFLDAGLPTYPIGRGQQPILDPSDGRGGTTADQLEARRAVAMSRAQELQRRAAALISASTRLQHALRQPGAWPDVVGTANVPVPRQSAARSGHTVNQASCP